MKMVSAYPIGISGIGDHNSISSGPDDGANSNLRRIFWSSMGHSTTDEAVNNFLSRLGGLSAVATGAGNLNLGGHGNEGLVETGCGQHGNMDYKTNYLTTWNKPWWNAAVTKLNGKSFPILYIYSCHTGAGEAGADFLFELAKTIGKPAAARTGFTYSNVKELWFEANSVWQVATPDARPTPIPAPTPHFTAELEMNSISLTEKGRTIVWDVSNIVRINIKRGAMYPAGQQHVSIAKELFGPLIAALFGSEPYELPGKPSAVITAIVEIVASIDKKEEVRTFSVYNDRLAVDTASQFAYFVRPDFRQLIAAL